VVLTTKVLVSLGGNAILKHTDKGTAREQFSNTAKTSQVLVNMLKEDYHIVLTHGNGPQVGDILLAYDISKDTIPPMPLDVCVAQTQGMIGFMLQLSLENSLIKENIEKSIVTILTQTIIDKNDPQLNKPSKPIGPFYSAEEAKKLRNNHDWVIINDSGRGYRRVVPSPLPVGFIEESSIKTLYNEDKLIIACGGGGIPVMKNDTGLYEGVEAVVDKDHTSSLLASKIDAEVLLILTDVENVSINYGKQNQKDLNHLTIQQAKNYLAEGQFPPGTMGPKIESTIDFIEAGGKKAIITSIENSIKALNGHAGTIITLN
jgi:carbamate kinase